MCERGLRCHMLLLHVTRGGKHYWLIGFSMSFFVYVGEFKRFLSKYFCIAFSECCRFENGISPTISLFCSENESQDFVADSNALKFLIEVLQNSEKLGMFLAFRCLHCKSKFIFVCFFRTFSCFVCFVSLYILRI